MTDGTSDSNHMTDDISYGEKIAELLLITLCEVIDGYLDNVDHRIFTLPPKRRDLIASLSDQINSIYQSVVAIGNHPKLKVFRKCDLRKVSETLFHLGKLCLENISMDDLNSRDHVPDHVNEWIMRNVYTFLSLEEDLAPKSYPVGPLIRENLSHPV